MIYLASYTGTRPGVHGVVNRAIRWLDAAAHSHSEVCHSNPFVGPAQCHSATGMDGGVRIKLMQLSPEKWDVLPVPWVTVTQAREVYDKAFGKRYDYFGVGRFAVPFLLREHPTRDFCSEYAGRVLGLPQPWRLSPTGLHLHVLARLQKVDMRTLELMSAEDIALVRLHGHLGGDVSTITDHAAHAEVAKALGVKLRIEGGV